MTRKQFCAAAVLVFAAIAMWIVSPMLPGTQPAQQWTVDHSQVSDYAGTKLADNQLVVLVGTNRPYGYRIGDIIPVRIRVVTKPGVRVNFDDLVAGVISTSQSPFELVGTPALSQHDEGDKVVYEVNLMVRAFSVEKSITFAADFYYATDTLTGGQPDWLPASTPPLTITTSRTASEDAKTIEQGPTGDQPYGSHPLGWALDALGALLLLAAAATVVIPWWRRRHPPHVPSDAERFWVAVEDVSADTLFSGWTERHYMRLAGLFREYLKREAETFKQMGISLKEHPKREQILAVQETIDDVLYADRTLSEQEHNWLLSELEKVVARPNYPVKPSRKRRFSWLGRGLSSLLQRLPRLRIERGKR